MIVFDDNEQTELQNYGVINVEEHTVFAYYRQPSAAVNHRKNGQREHERESQYTGFHRKVMKTGMVCTLQVS